MKAGTLVRGYYFCYFGAQACMASYFNVYLEQQLGFGGRELGWFSSLTTLAPAAVCCRCWGFGRTGPAKAAGCSPGALGAVLLGAGLLRRQTGLGVLLWGAVWETARSACVSLADKGAVELCGDRGAAGYGSLRFGSLGFLAGGGSGVFAARQWTLGRVLFPVYLAWWGRALLLSLGFPGQPIRPSPRGAKR